jgi:hypothetical protein
VSQQPGKIAEDDPQLHRNRLSHVSAPESSRTGSPPIRASAIFAAASAMGVLLRTVATSRVMISTAFVPVSFCLIEAIMQQAATKIFGRDQNN